MSKECRMRIKELKRKGRSEGLTDEEIYEYDMLTGFKRVKFDEQDQILIGSLVILTVVGLFLAFCMHGFRGL
jgi:hypothetical protein